MSSNEIELVEYRPELRADFERLNLLWLEGHSLLEPLDLAYLRDPEYLILADGGQVFFAMRGSEVLGTCAAIRVTNSRFELAKLSVEPAARGDGVGRRLCEKVVQYARDNGATDIFLTSHTSLATAIRLYESFGFRHEPLPDDIKYETANVYMTMSLQRGRSPTTKS